VYDPRVGRFLSTDPLAREFASLSSYQYAMNTPIQATDLDGAEAKLSNEDLGRSIAITTVMTAWEIRNSITNTFLRMNSDLETAARIYKFAQIGITDPEVIKNYQLRMRTVVVNEEEILCLMCPNGTEIVRTYRREAVLEPKNSAGRELIEAGLDVLSIGSSLLLAKTGTVNSPVLFARGSGAIVMGMWRTSMTILYNVRRLSSVGANSGLQGVHQLDNVMEAGMSFVGPNAKELYAKGGRFIGWESNDGLKRFRPPAYKQNLKKYQANFEQRTSREMHWDNSSDAGSRSNVHVDTDKGFDYNSKRKEPDSQNSGTNN